MLKKGEDGTVRRARVRGQLLEISRKISGLVYKVGYLDQGNKHCLLSKWMMTHSGKPVQCELAESAACVVRMVLGKMLAQISVQNNGPKGRHSPVQNKTK